MAEQTQDTSIESLLDQLQNSSDAYVRGWAADLLGERAKDNEQVLGALRIAAQADKNTSVRDTAMKALRKLGENVEQMTNFQAAGVGAKAGIGPIVLIFLFALPSFGLFGIIVAIVVGLPGVLLGIVGAIAANALIKSSTATWVGGILGAILGIALWIFSGGVYGFCFILGGC